MSSSVTEATRPGEKLVARTHAAERAAVPLSLPDDAARMDRFRESTVREHETARLATATRLLAPFAYVRFKTAAGASGVGAAVLLRACPESATRPDPESRVKRLVRVEWVLAYLRQRVGRVAAARAHRGVYLYAGRKYKLGDVVTTVVARQSCPTDCRFRLDGGCYAESDQNRQHWDVLTEGSAGATPLELARREAELIDACPRHLPLRLHVAGDSPTAEAAGLVAAACERYTARGRGRAPVWGYTHAWRVVPRTAWRSVSVLASCETPVEAVQARAAGYAPALVVAAFQQDAAYPLPDTGGLKLVPCPAMTRADVTCTKCRLCFDDRKLLARGLVIGFAVHGAKKFDARASLRKPLPMA